MKKSCGWRTDHGSVRRSGAIEAAASRIRSAAASDSRTRSTDTATSWIRPGSIAISSASVPSSSSA